MVISFIWGYLMYFFAIKGNKQVTIIVDIIFALFLIARTIIMFEIAIRQASSLRTVAWAKILTAINLQFSIEFLV